MAGLSEFTDPLDKSEATGIVAFIVLAIGIGAGGAWLADVLHIDATPVVAVLGGIAVIFAAIFRWWPFWWHVKALLVRSILGDRGAMVFYVVVGVGLTVWGGLRIRDWSADATTCRRLYFEAQSPQDRIRALNHVPRAGAASKPGHLSRTTRTCDRYRDFGSF